MRANATSLRAGSGGSGSVARAPGARQPVGARHVPLKGGGIPGWNGGARWNCGAHAGPSHRAVRTHPCRQRALGAALASPAISMSGGARRSGLRDVRAVTGSSSFLDGTPRCPKPCRELLSRGMGCSVPMVARAIRGRLRTCAAHESMRAYTAASCVPQPHSRAPRHGTRRGSAVRGRRCKAWRWHPHDRGPTMVLLQK